MRRPHLLLRVATVVSSILLVAAFISYRAGAFDGLLGTSARRAAIMGGSDPRSSSNPADCRKHRLAVGSGIRRSWAVRSP
jgi:hypothetical protein